MVKKHISLRELITAECANWTGGQCLISDCDCGQGTGCKVLQGSERCGYFEKALGKGTRLYPEWLPAVREYEDSTGGKTARHPIHSCACGVVIAPRMLFCPECRKRRKRETARNRMKARRNLSPVTKLVLGNPNSRKEKP